MAFRKKEAEKIQRPFLPVTEAHPSMGLTSGEAALRVQMGYRNDPVEPPSKTVKQIIASNTLTFFNFIFVLLAVCVVAVTDWKDPDLFNLTFLIIVIVNAVIGIFQELRSKRTLDKLTILSESKAVVIRDGVMLEIPQEEVVRDDIAVFAAGNQIFADAVVVDGEVQANESLVTGESDEIRKKAGDPLLSGSFLIGGSCRARITAVGEDSFVSRLTVEAKKANKHRQPEMMRSLSRLIKWIGFIVIPFGVAMAVKEISWLNRDVPTGILSTVASITGMIPEGLYFLTSVALATGAARLARKKTLLHEMGCIETLARVDVFCADKTGTITETKMIVEDVVPLCPDR